MTAAWVSISGHGEAHDKTAEGIMLTGGWQVDVIAWHVSPMRRHWDVHDAQKLMWIRRLVSQVRWRWNPEVNISELYYRYLQTKTKKNVCRTHTDTEPKNGFYRNLKREYAAKIGTDTKLMARVFLLSPLEHASLTYQWLRRICREFTSSLYVSGTTVASPFAPTHRLLPDVWNQIAVTQRSRWNRR